jgi:hypothetical protein
VGKEFDLKQTIGISQSFLNEIEVITTLAWATPSSDIGGFGVAVPQI